MDVNELTLRIRRLDQDTLWDLSGVSALDTYVVCSVMLNATESIHSFSGFTLELEALPTSTTQLEYDFAESVLPLSFNTASNQVSINSSNNVDWLTGMAADAAYVGDLKNDLNIKLTTLGNDDSRFKDELTADETVDLAHSIFNPSTSAKWKSQDSVGIITLQNQGVILTKDYRVRDGLTVNVKVSLAQGTPSTNNSFTTILGKVSQVNDLIVTLENKRATPSENSRFKDGLTANGTVSLTQGTNNPFTGTSWKSQDSVGIITLQNQGAILNKDSRLLNELTTDKTVSLTQGTNNPFTGTSWKSQDSVGIITLQNQGAILTKDSRLLNELTTDRTVSLTQGTNNPFTGTSWKSQDSVGIITLQNQGAILTKDYHVWDGLTEGTVSLTQGTNNPSTSTQWKTQVNDLIITLENKRTILSGNYHVWDGLKADRTVNLAHSTNNPFISTKERVFNIQNEFSSDNPIIEESRENVTPKFLRKVFEILERLDTVPENSMGVIGSQASGSYPSSERNDLSESVSLIQFTDNGVQHSSTRGLASR